MSLREKAIEAFYTEYGYLPDENDLRKYLDDNYEPRFEDRFSNFRGPIPIRNSNPESELIDEVKNIFSSISSIARNTSKNGKNTFEKDELSHMFMLFLTKASLYLIIKSCYQKGYDFTNI